MRIQMNRAQGTPNHIKSQSTDNTRGNSRKGSGQGEGASHLQELRDRGKKVLRRLIPSQPMVLIKKLVQKGAGTLKRELLHNQKLLPSLTLKNVQAELLDRQSSQHQGSSFEEMNQKLTHSMLFFLQGSPGNTEEAEILRLQTEKCYRKIPRCFFQDDLSGGELGRLLTRDARESQSRRDELSDYYDEVEFNVNQQVAYKMKVFMGFVSFLTKVSTLADFSLGKIAHARANNNVVREIVVQRAERVNALRARKEEVQQCLAVLGKLKKMKRLQNLLMSQVQAKGRIALAEAYKQYCQVHEEIKEYCCRRLVCRYWDVAYYIQRGYHDSFSRSLKSYLREIIVLDEGAIRNIMQPKQDYSTSHPVRSFNMGEVSLDESYEVEEGEVELVTKHNIQREIVSIFKLGLRKCTYSTDQICEEIRTAVQQCFQQLFRTLRGDLPALQPKPLSEAERRAVLQRLALGKYVRVVEEWSSRMKKVVRRQASVIEKALSVACDLRDEFPEKQQVISSYLMQILYITFLQVDESIAFLIKGRKLKLHQSDPVRQLLLCSQQWKELILDFKTFHNIWSQLLLHFASAENRSTQKIQKNKSEALIIEGLLGKFLQTRQKVVELMIDIYSKTSIENLPLRLQEDEWRTVSIPSRYYNTLGEVVYGTSFSKHIESVERKLLSSSLLLERNSSLLVSHDHQALQSCQTTPQFDLQVGECMITLNGQAYKVIASTLAVIDFLHGYLQWVEETGEGELLEETVLGKVMEFIIMYNENIKKLIIGKEALNYGKIKSKSITAKHLVTAYSQLKFFKGLTQAIAKRFSSFAGHAAIIAGLLEKNMAEISKKFRAILQLAINESINKIVVDPRKSIAGPVPQTVQIVTAVNRSTQYVREILGGEKEMSQFVGVGWCGRYLQQVKGQYRSVYKSIMNSNGTRKSKDIDWTDNIYWKFKELEYVVQNLQEFRDYLPGFDAIAGELELERKKLQNPH